MSLEKGSRVSITNIKGKPTGTIEEMRWSWKHMTVAVLVKLGLGGGHRVSRVRYLEEVIK